MLIGLNGIAVESTAEQVTRSGMFAIELRTVDTVDKLHECREIRLGGREHHMDMVAHEHVGEDAHASFDSFFLKEGQVPRTISFVPADVLVSDPVRGNVVCPMNQARS